MKLRIIALFWLAACGWNERIPPDGPVAPSAIVVSARTSSAVTLTWAAASDDKTAVDQIEYKVVLSGANNLRTLEAAKANGTMVLDWTKAVLSFSLSDMSASTTYYFALLARDAEGNEILYDMVPVTTQCSGRVMFVATVASGALGSIAAADAVCNANKPTGLSAKTFKAMVAQDAIRVACTSANCASGVGEHIDWVFPANTSVCRSDYELQLGITNSVGLLDITVADSIDSSSTPVYTGLRPDWQNHSNCFNWSTTASTSYYGRANGTGTDFYSTATGSCAQAGRIYCVEQ